MLTVVVLLAACGGGAPAADEEAAPTPSTARAAEPEAPPAASAGGAAAAPPLPDITQGLVRGACEDGPGVHGADSYFVGELTIDGEHVTGEERWILFANEKWKEKGGSDCEIRWTLSGYKAPVRSCKTCDWGVVLDATPDIAGSSCVEDLVEREAKPGQFLYDVKEVGPDRVRVYFARSGKLLGEGWRSGNRMNYRSDHQCKWF